MSETNCSIRLSERDNVSVILQDLSIGALVTPTTINARESLMCGADAGAWLRG